MHLSLLLSFLRTVIDSARMRAVVTPERTLAIQQLAASFKTGNPHPLKAFQRMLGLMASASSVLQLGLLHASVLAETTRSSTRLVSRTPPCQGEPALRCSSGPLEKPSVDGMGHAPVYGLLKDGGLNRSFQLRLGALCGGKQAFGLFRSRSLK